MQLGEKSQLSHWKTKSPVSHRTNFQCTRVVSPHLALLTEPPSLPIPDSLFGFTSIWGRNWRQSHFKHCSRHLTEIFLLIADKHGLSIVNYTFLQFCFKLHKWPEAWFSPLIFETWTLRADEHGTGPGLPRGPKVAHCLPSPRVLAHILNVHKSRLVVWIKTYEI